jgi:hypothetical protein
MLLLQVDHQIDPIGLRRGRGTCASWTGAGKAGPRGRRTAERKRLSFPTGCRPLCREHGPLCRRQSGLRSRKWGPKRARRGARRAIL